MLAMEPTGVVRESALPGHGQGQEERVNLAACVASIAVRSYSILTSRRGILRASAWRRTRYRRARLRSCRTPGDRGPAARRGSDRRQAEARKIPLRLVRIE